MTEERVYVCCLRVVGDKEKIFRQSGYIVVEEQDFIRADQSDRGDGRLA